MFSRHRGNEFVKSGNYLCLHSGEFVDVPSPGAPLPGSERALYLAVSPIVALLVGPIAGLLFVLFLPLAVPMFICWLIVGRFRGRAAPALAKVSEAFRPQAMPPAYAAGATPPPPSNPPQPAGPERQPLDMLLADIDRMLAEMEGKPERE